MTTVEATLSGVARRSRALCLAALITRSMLEGAERTGLRLDVSGKQQQGPGGGRPGCPAPQGDRDGSTASTAVRAGKPDRGTRMASLVTAARQGKSDDALARS
jgi:hypothetical protein